MSFSFSFEENESVESETNVHPHISPFLQPQTLDFKKMVYELPDRISYSLVQITSSIVLGRRDLYDIKLQMISEEEELLDTYIGANDLIPGIYEGGFKTWESTGDLITYLHTLPLAKRMVELGCGSGLPSCFMLMRALKQGREGLRIILQDYNESVLALSAVANILICWWICFKNSGDGEVQVTDELKEEFCSDLERRGIVVEVVSGGWKESAGFYTGMGELVVSSESWYSLDSMDDLVQLIGKIIGKEGKAVVAGKRHYFGVGGGTDMFLEQVRIRGFTGVLVKSIETGVARDIVEVSG
ncbi:Histidine protein methyltransferase 1 [Neolecta irregularis DAH-3]|uniref:protein-histidine N-methyltransferase n=1 Tax=Neolecta irregularis (strain DAH-3) TaxID=1198029 RepID=A0A1U7LLC6_NEOID|nr:Histidine protein methyltransferase 1 [Neolecta irregularis DAH-3]|eukprot:OLL23457.1 Histidine protein methyltransferase 1 [Neolecta irregularis DAH-3]